MSVHDSDLQAAVDSTSVAKDTGETDLVQYLRDQLAERDIETNDEAWLNLHGREDQGRPELHDRVSEPDDYDPERPEQADEV